MSKTGFSTVSQVVQIIRIGVDEFINVHCFTSETFISRHRILVQFPYRAAMH